MSYQEKRTITSMLSGALVLAAYCIYVLGKYNAAAIDPSDLKFWSTTMLVFIGIGVVGTIIIQIVFHILLAMAITVKEKKCSDEHINKTIESSMVEDEMDKIIELKSLRAGFIFAGIGFVLALLALTIGYSAPVMLNILFISFSLGSLSEGLMSMYYYRKGV